MNKKKDLGNSFILIGVIAGLVALLDYIGVVVFPFGVLGVSAFYIGFAFYTAFAIWFKSKALIAMYIGLLIGALISGTFTVFAFILALGNVVAAAIPMLVFRWKKLDFELKRPQDFIAYIISATILQSIVSAAWVLYGFYLFGIMPGEAAIAAATGWILGDILVSIIIGIPLLKWVSPLVKRLSIYVK